MPNYSKGKIYQIISPNYPLPYIGSTVRLLCQRMADHRVPNNRCSSRIVIDAGDAYIELIEEYPCDNKEQLNKREGEIIRQRECVNRAIAGRTRHQRYEETKEENKEKISLMAKTYYEANKEAIATKAKTYYEANKEAFALRAKAYREANREKIRQQQALWYQRKIKEVSVE